MKGFHAQKMQAFVQNYINEYMKDKISPEMAARYAVNLTLAGSSGLSEVMYLLEDPVRIKGKFRSN